MPPPAALTIRLIAAFDLAVTALFALPFTAPAFVNTLYALDRALGGPFATPILGALGLFFTNLAGALGTLWALVRCAVAALIGWNLAADALPSLLWAFVATELLGAAAQVWVTRR